MAVAKVQSAMNFGEHKTLHAFFPRAKRAPSSERSEPLQNTIVSEADQTHDEELSNTDTSAGNNKKRGRKSDKLKEGGRNGSSKSNQASLERFTRRSKDIGDDKAAALLNTPKERVSTDIAFVAGFEPSFIEEPNADRRKRRKTASPPHMVPPEPNSPRVSVVYEAQYASELPLPSWHEQLYAEATKSDQILVEASSPQFNPQELPSQNEDAFPRTPTMTIPDIEGPAAPPSPLLLVVQPSETTLTLDVGKDLAGDTIESVKGISPKKKQLKINKKGRFSSPVSKTARETASPKKARARKPIRKSQPTTITIIKYGSDAEGRADLGNRINEIMDGKKGAEKQLHKANSKPKGPPKPTHPFFLGKPTEKKEELVSAKETAPYPLPKTPRKTAVTPGKLRAEAQRSRSPAKSIAFRPILDDTRVLKHHGLLEAPWPSKESAHVRGLGDSEKESVPLLQFTELGSECVPSMRKLKRNVVRVSDEEDIIFTASQNLIQRSLDLSNQREEAKVFRMPERLLTTGRTLVTMVKDKLRAQVLKPDGEGFINHNVHPALRGLFSSIEDTLTPFDNGECETQAWTQKYAPKVAAEVLLPGKEAVILRDWLKSLTVKSVEVSKLKNRPDARQKPAKKRRKKDLDDFIVFEGDDDDEDAMDELTDPEDIAAPSRLGWKRSLVSIARQDTADDTRSTKRKNAVLLSGPPGCGKTATVYAVAKELGFEVFEINPGTRRSGKDILDKVGDMSENHLVNHTSGEQKTTPIFTEAVDLDQERMAEEVQKDIDSGRQGTMTSFFKPAAQPKIQANAKAKSAIKVASKAPANVQSIMQKPQNQKQSLILLEEVDVLFKEDENFWTTVLKLATQSKRPIVLTCNDESLVAMEALPLHAILRLCPPPVDLASDYLLLLAAKEGHMLERKAVCDLYTSRDYDLRASITELDFWCQMSVGDRKGGLEWIYQRWPPGKDVDEHGRILRVASKGTYQSGMGWMSHDIVKCNDSPPFDKEEELLSEGWSMWGISPECWSLPQKNHPESTSVSAIRRNIQTLRQLEGLLDCVSAADTYCRVGLPFSDMEPTDPSQPPMPRDYSANFTTSYSLLQADPLVDFTAFGKRLSVRTNLAVQRVAASLSILYFTDLPRTHLSDTTSPETYTTAILAHKAAVRAYECLTRYDFSDALDPLAVLPSNALTHAAPSSLVASSFDREFRVIIEDLAPYARSIVKHEQKLEAERICMSNLMSHGGRAKRLRTTRAARSAVEGGRREEKRRERWFTRELNMELVMATGGKSWSGLGTDVDSLASESRRSGSIRTIISDDEECGTMDG